MSRIDADADDLQGYDTGMNTARHAAGAYRHTQRATVIIAACVAGIVALVAWSVVLPAPIGVVLAVIIVLAASAVCFSSLTIEIVDGVLSWHFAFGLFRRTLPVTAVQATESRRIPVLYGWGIHRTPEGWLYNVSGRDAVLVRVRDNTAVLLGTDEPDTLRAALQRS